MMKNALLLLPLLFFLTACQQQVDPQLQEELSGVRIRLQEMEAEVEQLRAGPGKGQLAHIVFLHLQEGLSEEETGQLVAEIRKLGALDMVKNLEIGRIADTGDDRFISDHGLAFQMTFENLEVYRTYQEHPEHQAIRDNLKPYLAGPPAVYDYWVE